MLEKIKKGDVIVFAAVLTAAALLLAMQIVRMDDDAAAVEILADRKSAIYPLDGELSIPLECGGFSLTVEIDHGRVRVKESNCPGGDCVRCGWISRGGGTIICAPAGVVIRLSGGEVDYIAG